MTPKNNPSPQRHTGIKMAPRGRTSSGTHGVAPATINSLPTKTTMQLTRQEVARMSNPLQSIEEQALPPYDRNADIVWFRGIESNPQEDFIRSVPDLKFRRNKQQGAKMIFFEKIPLDIRCRIYAFVFEYPPNGKQVNLSKDFTTKDVFPPDFFISPWDLLQHIEGALSACMQMRDELFTYFWNTYHFHVTFSPYSIGPVFSGVSIRLLNGYASRVNHLTVEVDMTKLSHSAARDAKLLKQSNKKLHKVLVNLVIALGRRRFKGNSMASLTLLARRYKGFRPARSDAPEDQEVPYCPDKALYLFNCFTELKPLVLQCRMSGFSICYTRQLLKAILIPPFLTKPRPAPVIPAWPYYTPTTPEVAYLSNISATVKAEGSPGSTPGNIAGSSTGSADMPGFRTTIPSFGYSQASSSAGSLIPPNGQQTGLDQVQEDSAQESQDQSSGEVLNTRFISSLNLSAGNVENPQWTGSNSQLAGSNARSIGENMSKASYTPTSHVTPGSLATPGSTATPRAGPYMTDNTGIPITDGDSINSTRSTTSTSRMTVSSFGTPRAITAPETGIPIPRRGTARSFRSRHGYTVNLATGTPPADSGAFTTPFGLGISMMDSAESPSFADEVEAEMARRERASLPQRKDSLPGAARSPSTIHELNEMNEMDPAFARAVEGLRMASPDGKGGAEEDSAEEEVGGDMGVSSTKDKKKEKNKKKKTTRKHWF